MRTTKTTYLAITLSLIMLFVGALGSQLPLRHQNLIAPAAADDGLLNHSVQDAVDIDVASEGFRWYSGTDPIPGGPGGLPYLYLNQTDDDFFNVTVLKDYYFWAEIEFNESQVDLELFLYDEGGIEIDNSTGAGNTEWVGALADSTAEYTVQVAAYNDSYNATKGEGDYNLTLGIDDIYDFPDIRGGVTAAPDYSTAPELVEGYYDNLVLAENDNDIYKVLLYPGNSLTVNLTFSDPNADLDLLFYNSSVVENPAAGLIKSSKNPIGTDESVVLLPDDLTGPGYYYIQAIGSTSADNSYYALNISNHEDNREAGVGFLAEWGVSGSENGNFSYPTAVAVNGTGYIYVADTMNDRIQVFDPSGNYAFQWGSTGSAAGQFKYPMGIAIHRTSVPNRVFVSDTYNHRVQLFSATGTWLNSFGYLGSEKGNFTYPVGIEVKQQVVPAEFYIADMYNHRIQKFKAAVGTPNLFSYDDYRGAYGTGNGYFHYPSDIAIDTNGAIYVTDTFNHRIQKFSNTLTFVGKWGAKGSESGQFLYPRGIANDSSNNIYIVDSGNNRVQVFDSNGNFVAKWGHLGSNANEFRYPYGVAVNSGGDIYIADTQNNRIQSFAFVDTNDEWKNAFSLAEGNIEIGFTHKYAGLLASTNRSDWYKFYLLEAQSIRFRLDFYHVLSDFDFYLYDGSQATTRAQAGQLNPPISWSNQSASDTETIGQIRIPENGTYYLWITSKNESATNRFYNLTVQIRGVDDEYEENDELITPTVLPTEDATYPLFSLINDADFFGVPLLQDDFLKARIEFNNSLGNLDLYLYSITGALLNDSTSTGTSFEEVSWHTMWDSFFIIEIRGINSSFAWVGVEYNLIITITASDDQFEQNDAWGTPSSIAEGNWEDLILRDGDDDWYQVYLVQGDHISIELIIGDLPEERLQSNLLSVSQDEEEEPMDADLSVFVKTGLNTGNVDEDLELIDRSETSEMVEFIEFTAPRTEVYLIWVEFFVGPNGNYTLLIDIAETDDIYEDNDNMEEATEFTVEGEVTYEDLLIRTLDDDWYKFYVEKGYGIYANISFSHLQGDLNLYLISENDTILAYSNSNDSDLEQFAPYEAKSTAWYYVVVKQISGTHNSYSLSIDTGPYEELVAKYPNIPPAPTGEYEIPEEGEDTIFGLPAVVVITVAVISGGAVLGGGGFLGFKKVKGKIKKKGGS